MSVIHNRETGLGIIPLIIAAATAAASVYAAKKGADASKSSDDAAKKRTAAEIVMQRRDLSAQQARTRLYVIGGAVAVAGLAALLVLRNAKKKGRR